MQNYDSFFLRKHIFFYTLEMRSEIHISVVSDQKVTTLSEIFAVRETRSLFLVFFPLKNLAEFTRFIIRYDN